VATTNNPYWISYTGSAQNDGTGGVSIFSNGDIASAVTKTNSNGTSSIQVDRINSSGIVLWSVNLDADYSPGAGSILVGANNNVYIVGGTKKGATGESGKNDSDVFATSLSPNGELLWYKNYGIGIHEIGSQAVIDQSGDLVLNGRVSEVNDGYNFIKDVSNFYGAEFSGGWRGFQLKIDSDDGSVLKGYTTGSYNSGGELIAVNKSNNTVFVGGYTFGSVNGVGTIGDGDPAGANKYLIARNESNGEVLWTRMENWIRSNVVVQESEDAIYFVDKGILEKVKGSTGETLWSKPLDNIDYKLASAKNGGILISEGSSTGELTINRIDSNGATVGSQLITHQGNLYPGSFTEQADGSIIVSGTTSGIINVQDNVSILNSMKGGNDAFILKIDSNFSEPRIPTYSVTQAPTPSVAEGATLTTSVQTTELAAGTEVFWSAGGTGIDADDFTSGALTGTGTVGADGKFSFTHSIKNDNKTEGNETLQVKLYSDSARNIQVGTTANTTINDSSKTPPTYSVTQAPTPSVAEGATLTTSVQTTELAEGTNVYWSAGGTNIDADDFTAGALTGTGTVGADGKFSFSHSIKNDNKTEGNEILDVKLFSDSARTQKVGDTASTTITDSSKTPPTYSVTQSPTVTEGATLTTSVATTGVDQGKEFFWSATGTGIDADDFTEGAQELTGQATVGADGKFSFTHSIKNDNKTEGNEILDVKLFSDSARTTQVGTTANTTITDSSKTPPTYNVTQSSNSINEGGTLNTTVRTTDLAVGTKVYWSADGTRIDAKDFSAGALSGEGIVSADGTFTFSHTLAYDNKTEGNENLQIKLYSDSAHTSQVGNTASTTIIDTSRNSVIVTKQEGDAHAGINEDLPRGQSNVVGIKATSLDVNGNGDFISDVDSTSTADATTGNGNASTHVRQSILGISISDSSRIGGEGKFSSIITHDSANSARANNGTANVEDHLNSVGIDVSTLRVQGKSTFSSFMSTRSQNSADTTQTNDENISTDTSATLNRNQLLGEPNIVGMRFDRLTLDNKGVFTSQLENISDTGAVSIKGDASTFSNNSVLGIGFNGASRISGDAQVTSLLTQRSFSDAQSVHGTAITEDHHSVIGVEAHDLTVTGNASFSSTVVVRALSNSGT